MNATKKFSCIQHDSSEQMYELMQTALGVKEWKAVDFQCTEYESTHLCTIMGVKEWKAVDFQCAEYECAHLCTTMWYSVCAEKLFLFFCSSNSCVYMAANPHINNGLAVQFLTTKTATVLFVILLFSVSFSFLLSWLCSSLCLLHSVSFFLYSLPVNLQ